MNDDILKQLQTAVTKYLESSLKDDSPLIEIYDIQVYLLVDVLDKLESIDNNIAALLDNSNNEWREKHD